MVSTHSRLKAAGRLNGLAVPSSNSFNTQPPEGGWYSGSVSILTTFCFNTQPPEGGWTGASCSTVASKLFQHTAA